MPVRESPVERGRARGRRLVVELLRAAEEARIDRGISYRQMGRALGITGEQAGRICRGKSQAVSVVRLAEVIEIVGLELSARTYPGSQPLRDAGHHGLLDRFRARLHPSLGFQREVPVVRLPGALDRRAWDAVIAGPGWSVGVEAETHVRDVQGLERRIALKERDGAVGAVILLLIDSRWHRDLVRGSPELREHFPIPARAALRALGRGHAPGGDAILLL